MVTSSNPCVLRDFVMKTLLPYEREPDRQRDSDLWTVGSATVLSAALYGVVALSEPAMTSHAHRRAALLIYTAAVAGLFAVYRVLLRDMRQLQSPTAMRLAFVAPLVFQLTWLAIPPRLSIDVLSYIADGYLWRLGLNPYTHASRAVAATGYAASLAAYGWRPVHGISPYGPLWMSIEIAVTRTAIGISTSILLIKALVLSANAMIAAAIFAIVDTGAEERRVATMLYWWNPLVIIECAAEGHNDALMVLPVMLGLYLLTKRQAVGGIVALTAAVLVKYLPVLFGGPALVYLWRTSDRRRFARTMLAAASLAIVLAVCAYAPLWAGRNTFRGVRTAGTPTFGPGTSGGVFWVLARVVGAARAAKYIAVGGAIFLLTVVAASSRRVCNRETLFDACATVALAYVLVAAPRYWSWYVVMPTALLAVSPTRAHTGLIFVLTACAAVAAPWDIIRVAGAISWPLEAWATTLIGVWIPLLFWMAIGVRGTGAEPSRASPHSMLRW
jgi:hypothetical protein